jgi:hypothetical protein
VPRFPPRLAAADCLVALIQSFRGTPKRTPAACHGSPGRHHDARAPHERSPGRGVGASWAVRGRGRRLAVAVQVHGIGEAVRNNTARPGTALLEPFYAGAPAFARALAFSCSNSVALMAPESSRPFADEISSATETFPPFGGTGGVATDLM